VQGLQGAAVRYVRALLSSTRGYKHRRAAAEGCAPLGMRGPAALSCVPSAHGAVQARAPFETRCWRCLPGQLPTHAGLLRVLSLCPEPASVLLHAALVA
jgi:hypothetical protein